MDTYRLEVLFAGMCAETLSLRIRFDQFEDGLEVNVDSIACNHIKTLDIDDQVTSLMKTQNNNIDDNIDTLTKQHREVKSNFELQEC